ncbi:MAG: DUF2283 domain-containing protein [Phycisphaeraceae bacterium]
MAVRTDALEGVVDDRVWFHYDLTADVLYLRLASERDTPALGEETEEGFILLRAESDERIVGMTVVNWWSRFGTGDRPDSLRQLESTLAPWTHRMAA